MKNTAILTALAGVIASHAATAGNQPRASIAAYGVDNTFRVPPGSGFNPQEWKTYDIYLWTNCPVSLLGVSYPPAFRLPDGPDSIFPLPPEVYDDIPLARYASFFNHPVLAPEQMLPPLLPLGGFGPNSTNIFLQVSLGPPPLDIPVPDDARRIARMTFRVPAPSQFGDLWTSNTSLGCVGAMSVQWSVPLSWPFAILHSVKELNDQHDEFMDIELAVEGGWVDSKYEIPASIFFPASRIVSVEMLAPLTGWSVSKVYHEGEFGIRLQSDQPLEWEEVSTASFRAVLRDADIMRDVRLAFGIQSSDDGFFVRPYGYWAPVASALLAGDTNDDGVVDFTDLNNILADFGGPPSSWRTDFDDSGTVDFADLNAVLSAFGTTD